MQVDIRTDTETWKAEHWRHTLCPYYGAK